jgi:hypothetical protein
MACIISHLFVLSTSTPKTFVGKLSATQTVTFAHYGGRTSSNEVRLLERDAARIADLEHKSWPEKQLQKDRPFS